MARQPRSSNNVDRPAGAGGSSGRNYSTNSPSAENFARPAGQDARVDRNRQAAARDAAQAAERGDGFVPDHLREYLPGGAAYDPARERETRMGRIVGGISDRLDRLFGGSSAADGPRPVDRSPRPVPRGTPVSSPGLGARAVDFVQGRRPLVGLGGVIPSRGRFVDSVTPGFAMMGGGRDDTPVVLPPQVSPQMAPQPTVSGAIDYSLLALPPGMDPSFFQMLLQQAQGGNPQVLAPYFPGLFSQGPVNATNPLAAGQGIGSLV